MSQIQQTLSGKKTYILSTVTVLIGLLQLAQGLLNGSIPTNDWRQIVPYVMAGALGASLRAALAKIEAKLPAAAQPLAEAEVQALEGESPPESRL